MKKLSVIISAFVISLVFTCSSFGMMKSTGIVKPGDKAKANKATEETKDAKDSTKGKKVEKKEVQQKAR